MSIEQSKLHQLPISPSLSATSAPDFTQAPTSIKSILLSHGISDNKADELNYLYNRRSIPVMDDGLFFQLLNEIATDIDPDQVESELRRRIDQQSTSLYNEYVAAKHEIGFSGLDLFQTVSQQFQFTAGLRKHTIHGFEAFVASCLPPLIEACQKSEIKRRRRKNTSPKHYQRAPHGASKSSLQAMEGNGCRRSPRIAKRTDRAPSGYVTNRARLAIVC
jgi:hypothetical protein